MKVQLTIAALAICALASRYGAPYLLTTYECKWDGRKCAYYVECHYVNAYGEHRFYPDIHRDEHCPTIKMFSSFAPASPDDANRVSLLRRVHMGSYDRLAVDHAASKTPALTAQNEAVHGDLKSSGPGGNRCFQEFSLSTYRSVFYFPPAVVKSITPGTSLPPRQIRN